VEALVVTDPNVQVNFEVADLPDDPVERLLTLLFSEDESTAQAVAA
jgi:hypothetical protein